MNKFSFAALLATLILMTGCSQSEHHHEEDAHGHNHDNESASEHKHGDDDIVLHAHEAEDFGVEVSIITSDEITKSVQVAGEVVPSSSSQAIVSARSAGIVNLLPNASIGSNVKSGQQIATISAKGMTGGDANVANKIALDNAKLEYDRVSTLFKEGLATIQEYNAAKTSYQMAANALGGNSNGVSGATSPISGVITTLSVSTGEFVEAGATIATVSASGDVTVRADVPARYKSFVENAQQATIVLADGTTLKGIRSASAPNVPGMKGYVPVWFNVSSKGTLLPGNYVDVVISTNTGYKGISLPKDAVVEKLGQKFVYVQLDADCYERRPVELGGFDGNNYEIVSGINDGDKVVTKGATFVRLAETNGAVPEGHSHHH